MSFGRWVRDERAWMEDAKGTEFQPPDGSPTVHSYVL